MVSWSNHLDDAAAWVFGSASGRARIEPLLAQWDDEVGEIREDDAERDLLHAIRADWALCDVPTSDGCTWLARALRGEMGPAPEAWEPLRRTHVGLFEVFAGKVNWLRDLRGGVCVPVLDPLPILADREGPAALWEARVVIQRGSALLCRPPLVYPLELLPRLRAKRRDRFSRPEPALDWAALRKGWVRHARTRRPDARMVLEPPVLQPTTGCEPRPLVPRRPWVR